MQARAPTHAGSGRSSHDRSDSRARRAASAVAGWPLSVRRALLALVVIAAGFTLYLMASFLLPIMVAGMLALLLAPAVGALVRLRIPQPLGAGIVLLAVLAFLGVVGMHVTAPVQKWIETAPRELKRLERKIDTLMRPVTAVREATEKVTEIANKDASPNPRREVVVEKAAAGTALNVTVDTVITVLSAVMLLYFLLASGDLLLRKLVVLMPEREDKRRTIGILRAIQKEIGSYFATITLVNIALGTVSGLALWALGMPTPVVWGAAIALLNFLPYLGPLIITVLLTGVAMLTFDTPFDILAPAGTFLLLNFIEDQLILPFVLGKHFSVNPVVIFVWVLFWAWMWGIGGLLLAVPLLVAVRICAERIPILQPVAIILSRH